MEIVDEFILFTGAAEIASNIFHISTHPLIENEMQFVGFISLSTGLLGDEGGIVWWDME